MTQVKSLLTEGIRHHQAARFKEAERCYRSLLEIDPNHSDGLHLLGLIAMRFSKFPQAEALVRRAHQSSPNSAPYLNSLGEVFRVQGKLDDAETCFRKVLASDPKCWQALSNLGITLADGGNPREALQTLELALSIEPNNQSILINIGKAYIELSENENALQALDKALVLNQNSWEALVNKSLVLRNLNKRAEALDYAQRANELSPKNDQVLNTLGSVQMELGSWKEALDAFLLSDRISPNKFDTLCNLGNVYKSLSKFEDAESFFERALSIKKGDLEASYRLASVKLRLSDHSAARSLLNHCIERDSSKPSYWSVLGDVERNSRNIQLAESHYLKAIDLDENNDYLSSYLFNLNYRDDVDPLFVKNEHVRIAKLFSTQEKPCRNVEAKTNRLKVGLVSADWRLHPVAQFTESILRYIDKGNIELFCYSCLELESPRTQELSKLPEHWENVSRMSIDEFYERVKSDEIDILIDLMGHTSSSRLKTFAKRPAPVLITYLGYANTTGLEEIQYRISDSMADPKGLTDPHNTEIIYRLPKTAWCFTSRKGSPDVSDLPYKNNEYITFGSFNNFSKISATTIRLWIDILRKVPDSRLYLKNKSLKDSDVRSEFREIFERNGIEPGRLVLESWKKGFDNHLSAYCAIDIGLDTYPYCGTTTSCEALYMGVPLITLAGDVHASRVSASLLSNVGLTDDCVSETEDDYVRKAIKLAKMPAYLSELRKQLRPRMESSPLMDEKGFAQDFSEALRNIWNLECEKAKL